MHRQHEARAGKVTVDPDRAGAADPVLAADMGAGQTQMVVQEVREVQSGFDIGGDRFAVDGKGDVHCGRRLPEAEGRAKGRNLPWKRSEVGSQKVFGEMGT